jgi:hypothetical protein
LAPRTTGAGRAPASTRDRLGVGDYSLTTACFGGATRVTAVFQLP